MIGVLPPVYRLTNWGTELSSKLPQATQQWHPVSHGTSSKIAQVNHNTRKKKYKEQNRVGTGG
jgi:hypothetical protein